MAEPSVVPAPPTILDHECLADLDADLAENSPGYNVGRAAR
jgi:hypothetical protein